MYEKIGKAAIEFEVSLLRLFANVLHEKLDRLIDTEHNFKQIRRNIDHN